MGYSGSVNSEIFLVDYNLLSILRGWGEVGGGDFGRVASAGAKNDILSFI